MKAQTAVATPDHHTMLVADGDGWAWWCSCGDRSADKHPTQTMARDSAYRHEIGREQLPW